MKTFLFGILILISTSLPAVANEHFDMFLKAPKFIGVSCQRNFDNQYNYLEFNAGAGDIALKSHHENVYAWFKSHYFQPGLGLKFEDSGDVKPYFSFRLVDIEKISNNILGEHGLLRIGSEVICYSRTLDYYEEMKWLLFRTGIGYLFINSYPASLRAMINGNIGYTTIKLDSAINREFSQYAGNEFKNIDLHLGFNLRFEYEPVIVNLNFKMRSVLDKRSFSHVNAGAEISLTDYLTANVLEGNVYSLIDFANFDFYINCNYDSYFVENSSCRRLNIGAGFYYYFNNREPAQTYKEANY